MSNFDPGRYAGHVDDQEPTPTQQELVDYGDAEQYYDRDAFEVAKELFGEDNSHPGRFYSAAGSDEDVPFKIESHGDGQVVTYNMLRGEDRHAGWQGLNGYVISREEAEKLAHRKFS